MILFNRNDSLMSDLLTPTGGFNHFKYLFISNDYLTVVTLAVLSHWGIFVTIANNTLYGSKLYIFILCQKSLAYYVKIMFH